MADLTSDLLKSAAQAKLAGQGGYGGGSGLGKFLNFLLPAMSAALPNSPLFNGLDAGRQAINTANFNKYAQQQAEMDRANTRGSNQNDAELFKMATGQQLPNMDTGFDTGFAAQVIPKIRLSNQVANTNNFLNGQPLQMAQFGDLADPGMLQKYKERQGEVANAKATINFMADMLDQMNGQQAKPGEPVLQTDPNVLAAKVGMSDLYSQDPYGAGVPDIGQGIDYQNNWLVDRLGNRKAGEEERHNKKTESQTDEELRQKKEGNYYKNYPPAGGGSGRSPFTDLNGMQQYLGSQLESVEKQMKAAGFMDKDGNLKQPEGNYHYELPGGLFGLKFGQGGDSAKLRRFQAMNAKREQLLGQLSGGAFGGGQAQMLTQAGQNMGAGQSGFANWKKGKK